MHEPVSDGYYWVRGRYGGFDVVKVDQGYVYKIGTSDEGVVSDYKPTVVFLPIVVPDAGVTE